MTENNDIPDMNQETAQIPWKDLQRFFAGGKVVWVARELDLVDIAQDVIADNAAKLEPLIENKSIHPVSDNQARTWFSNDAVLWAVVIKPWVFVQEAE